jgi:hypothetical protein
MREFFCFRAGHRVSTIVADGLLSNQFASNRSSVRLEQFDTMLLTEFARILHNRGPVIGILQALGRDHQVFDMLIELQISKVVRFKQVEFAVP